MDASHAWLATCSHANSDGRHSAGAAPTWSMLAKPARATSRPGAGQGGDPPGQRRQIVAPAQAVIRGLSADRRGKPKSGRQFALIERTRAAQISRPAHQRRIDQAGVNTLPLALRQMFRRDPARIRQNLPCPPHIIDRRARQHPTRSMAGARGTRTGRGAARRTRWAATGGRTPSLAGRGRTPR